MRIRRLTGLSIVLATFICAFAPASESAPVSPAQLRKRLMESIGTAPWNPSEGYSLNGRFTLKAAAEEIPYSVRSRRSSSRQVIDFIQENPSFNLRGFASGTQSWISTPELTADLKPGQMPYMLQFDFHQLYDALLRILEKGGRDPAFSLNRQGNDIYVRGKLPNGWEAIFALNTVEYFPRKVHVRTGAIPSAAWMIPQAQPDGTFAPISLPGPSTEFEIWLSDPAGSNGYRYARRMDFAEHGIVLGTFVLDAAPALPGSEKLFQRPPQFPQAATLHFASANAPSRRPLYLNKDDRDALRARIHENPWAGWNRESRSMAIWAVAMHWAGRSFPHPVSLRLLGTGIIAGFLGFLLLLVRRSRQVYPRKFSWSLLAAGILAGLLVFVAGIAAGLLHRPLDRSRMALHTAIRYTVTDHPFYAARTDALFLDFAHEAPAHSFEDLGHSCQAYALAYDLIRENLPLQRRQQIEKDLFDYAKPLFSAAHGWGANTETGSVLASGLGMVGMAIGYEPFVDAARTVIDRALTDQLSAGLHRSGPGQGSVAMNSAANLFYGLKHTGRADYYGHAEFRNYVQTALQMLSPVGTLPLFGGTDLEHSLGLSLFFRKIAAHLPEEMGRRCVAAHNAYWEHGRFSSERWMKWILPLLQPAWAYYENPYIFLQYTRPILPSAPTASSATAGNGRFAVLRSGAAPDSMYLAINLLSTRSFRPHRDLLAFDLYAHRSLLLHGPGFPGKAGAGAQTAAGNSITMNHESQSGTQGGALVSSLLNQPVFDQVRVIADTAYDYGRLQRDAVLVRPEKNHPAYFFLLDDVFVTNPTTTVQWHLHGRGQLAAGIGLGARWTSTLFAPPGLRAQRALLEVLHPMGTTGRMTTAPGMLRSHFPVLNQRSQSTTIEWAGEGRFCTLLFPRKPGGIPVKVESLSKESCRIGTTDWISLGSLDRQIAEGPFRHVSEYILVRDRASRFPALLMISGLECRFGTHALFSNKPVSTSLNGLQGTFLNAHPHTRVEIISPEIRAGDRFLLDGQSIPAEKPGLLLFTLTATGEHALRRTTPPSEIP